MINRFQRQTPTARDHDPREDASQRGYSIDNDPLAELARLIGQADPHSNFGRANAVAVNPHAGRTGSGAAGQTEPDDGGELDIAPGPPPWMRTANAGRQQAEPAPYDGDAVQDAQPPAWSSQFRADEPPQISPMPAFLAHARQQASGEDEARYDHVLYEQPQSPTYPPQSYPQDDGLLHGDDHYSYAQPAPRRRSSLLVVGAVVALGVVGTASAFAYRTYGGSHRSGEPPIIKAETGAIKVVPPTSDASNKLINDRIAAGEPGKERLVSREEKPIEVATGAAPPRVVLPPLNSPPQQAMNSLPQAAPARPSTSPPAGAAADEPRRIRTLSIRSDQPDSAPVQRPSAPAAVTPPPAAAPRVQAAAPAPAAAPANAPMSLSPQAAGAPVRAASVAAAPTGGSYLVQIASQRTEADALASYRASQSKFPNLLGSRSAVVKKVDLGEKGIYFRAHAGPFASAEEANQLCASMRSAGGQCFVQRN